MSYFLISHAGLNLSPSTGPLEQGAWLLATCVRVEEGRVIPFPAEVLVALVLYDTSYLSARHAGPPFANLVAAE